MRCMLNAGVSPSETASGTLRGMNDKDPPNTLGTSWDHLFLTDRRTPKQKAEAQAKEIARRKGTGRKAWWNKHLAESDPGRDQGK